MNLTNLLDYGNIVYDLKGKINNITRKNQNAKTKPYTVIKMFLNGTLTKTSSLNLLVSSIFNSPSKRFKNIFAKNEFIPKTHAIRDCVNDMEVEDISKIHYDMIDTMKKNKVFDNHNYRGKNVVVVDGVEHFETRKNIDKLHVRNHKDGTNGFYYKSLGLMYMADDVNIMLDLVPFKKKDIKVDTEHNQKVKSEGEITVLKRIMPSLKKYNTEIVVLDCMFTNAPCFNMAKKNNIDVVSKLTDERRDIYKDASKLFETMLPTLEYEIVEVTDRKKVNYSKESKKKNTDETEIYTYTREITNINLNEKTVIEDKVTEHSKKTIKHIKTEKVIKRIQVWDDNFEMTNYENGLVKVIKTKEISKKETKEMYFVTTLINEDLEFLIDLMHRRWTIELNGFRTLKSRYNLDHLFVGSNNAIQIISYLILIVFNLIELYFNIHTKKYRHKLNFSNLLEEFKFEIASINDFYKYFSNS